MYNKSMEKAIIVAYGTDRAIGLNGDLPWKRDLPADLARFKRLTTGGDVIMGRKTFESIGSRPLPDRENIVISSRPTGVKGVLTAVNFSSALALCRYDTFVIGGARIYEEALNSPEITTIYATEVQAKFPEADTFFPELHPDDWQEVARERYPADDKNAYDFDFVEYRRASVTPQSAL